MELSLFTREYRNGRYRRMLNPYARIGRFELCIDRHGIRLSDWDAKGWTWSYIRGAGFHFERF